MEWVASKLQQLAAARILVVGDVMLDRYWKGDAERISPEAPVPIINIIEIEERLGGAANVAGNITSLGGNCTLLGIVGDDEAGIKIQDMSELAGIHTCLVLLPGLETTVKLRITSRNQQLLRADFEKDPGDEFLAALLDAFCALVADHDAVIFSDYGKGTLANISSLIDMALSHNKLVLVDPKGPDYTDYFGASIITPNLHEFEAVVGKVTSDEDLVEKGEKLISQYGLEKLLVTLSDKGMIMIPSDGDAIHIPARSREVFDVSGAGDTVIGVLAMAMATGMSDQHVMEIANSAAGVVVSKPGAATLRIPELSEAILRDYKL